MRRCFQLAKKGLGYTAPNPLVGSVIVAQNRIIGEGWHKQYGQAHAEVNAVASIAKADKHLLREATIYVNLEPCNHFGKTPPCVNLILEHKIPNVVVCNVDSNPLVGGKGIAHLRENGVQVTTGILSKKGRALNRRFFTFIEQKRPYIILKWAQTNDGFFARQDGQQSWITGEQSRQLVHKWRSEEAAILVGKNTLKIDNPRLNNRYFEQNKQPVRIVLAHDSITGNYHFLDNTQPTIIVNALTEKTIAKTQYWQFKFDENLLQNLLDRLAENGLQSLIVEGGAQTLHHFIVHNLWDEARVLTGQTTFEHGIPAPRVAGEPVSQFSIGVDSISILKNTLCNF